MLNVRCYDLRIAMNTVLNICWALNIMFAASSIQVVSSTAHFMCKEDICNRHGNDQFCSEFFGHCRDCKDILDECGKYTQPINCTVFCTDFLVAKKMKELSKTECPGLEKVENGAHKGPNSHRYGDVVVINCNKGFKLTTTGTLTCKEFGTWSHDLPSCKEIECPILGKVENGKHNGSKSHRYKDIVGITCNDGFEPTSAGTTTCDEFGEWSHDLPSCKDAGVDRKTWFFVIVAILGVAIVALTILCYLYIKLKKQNKTLVVENKALKGDHTERCPSYFANDDVKDETQQKLISDVDDETINNEQSVRVEIEYDSHQNAYPIPPRPFIDGTQVEPNNPRPTYNQTELHDNTDSTNEIPNDPVLKQPIKGSVSMVDSVASSLDTAETEDDVGELSSDSGITGMKTTKKEDNQGKSINFYYTTTVFGNGNITTTGNQNTVDAPNRTKQKLRRHSNNAKTANPPDNESDSVAKPPTQETGINRHTSQPESSSSDENSPDCARKSRIAKEMTDELGSEAIVCNPDDVTEKVQHVVVGTQDIPLIELKQ